MIWRVLLELGVFFLVPLFAVTQVLIPVWRGRRLFPLFRAKAPTIVKLDAARRELSEAELDLIVHKTQKEAEKVRSKLEK